ncbi:MAG TPA: hypothetical protein VID69_07545 [Actinomycetota bacterium]
MARRIRRYALVSMMILAAVVAPIAVPIRIVVLHLRRETSRIEFVARDERRAAVTQRG